MNFIMGDFREEKGTIIQCDKEKQEGHSSYFQVYIGEKTEHMCS
jgi:hypothetical protein